ncbi:hypothetical protein IFM46972_09204 [Aspergillus udagawae]|uniref:Uncharacterized protein n=1 Tax=Aspergillus udagawae TaxID=91492 RepID=A0A8H3PCW7_9EURO|nr:hypothetical protein IFM46972_09204 [Aspergillus udagawae]
MKIKLPFRLHPTLHEGWERGTVWFCLAPSSPTALFRDPAFWQITMPYWTFNAFQFIKHRVKDKEQYDASLHEAFESRSSHG